VAELDHLSDEELIRRSREEPALAARCLDLVFERAYPRLSQWCLRYTRNRDEAADLAQEVVLRAYTRLDSFRLESRFSTWLYTISRRVAIDRGIARRRREEHLLPEEAADRIEYAHSPSEVLELQQIAEAVAVRDVMIGELDPLEAQVVYLHYVDGMSLPAITELLDCRNKSGAKAYLVGGMRKLRRRFQQPADTKSTVL
jgi:RNA polymerase sigma-70 factor (ECF subfamily)